MFGHDMTGTANCSLRQDWKQAAEIGVEDLGSRGKLRVCSGMRFQLPRVGQQRHGVHCVKCPQGLQLVASTNFRGLCMRYCCPADAAAHAGLDKTRNLPTKDTAYSSKAER